jgi:hypothetical protein
MKKKVLGLLLAGMLLYTPDLEPMGVVDFAAIWLMASYASHAWCQWSHTHEMKPTQEVIEELKLCIKMLKMKVNQEQRDIRQCQIQLAEIKEELDHYKDRTSVAS